MAKNITNNRVAETTIRVIDDFLNNEVRDFAHYVVTTRALPNIMDGLRIGGRKILWAIINGDLRKYKKIKMVDLIGDTMKYQFHHGDASLKSTIEQYGSDHLMEIPLIKVIGQKGTLRVPDAKTAARYLDVALTKNIDIFRPDTDMFKLKFEDGKVTEPMFFMPIVPVVLLWRTNSPGFGFSFRSFSYKIEDIIDATLASVTRGTCSGIYEIPLRPRIDGIRSDRIIWNNSKQSWFNVGAYSIYGDKLTVTDLPYDVSFKKYTILLNTLKEDGVISDWFNYKTKAEPIKYVIHFATGKLAKMYHEKWKFYAKFKLYKKVPKLTLNVIDNDCRSIINFETPHDLIDGFVKRRLVIYQQRKVKLIATMLKAIEDLEDKAKFIQLVVDGKIVVLKRSKDLITADCEKYGVTTAGMSLEIYRLTPEEIDKARAKIAQTRIELEYIRKTSIEDMYTHELIELRRTLKGIDIGASKPKPIAGSKVVEYL
jgi:DNA topoisomerase-2